MTTCLLAVSPVFSQGGGGGGKGGGAPVGFAREDKLWNVTPNDVNNLLKCMKGMIDVSYTMGVQTLGEVNTNPEKNPILFRTGHYNFEYSPEERAKLRKYLLAGGMIVYNTGLGSAPFYRSTKKELEQVFPEQPMQRLSSDHPIFHSYYDVDTVKYSPGVYKSGFKGNEPWFDGVEINCRVVALVSRWCMAVGWQGEVKDEYGAYMPESALKMGINIFSYGTAMRAWSKSAAYSKKFVDPPKDAVSGKVALLQIMYDGVWKTRQAGMSVMLQTFNNKTDVPVKFALKSERLANATIFDSPLLYITGHEDFRFTKADSENLKKYLENGGFLFAEACCGRKGFDRAFREQIRVAMPGNPLKPIPLDNPIFKMPNEIKLCGITPALTGQIGGKNAMPPRLEGIEVNGRYVVVYSPIGMAGGWEMSQSPYAFGYNEQSSLQLGQNILMYAITQ